MYVHVSQFQDHLTLLLVLSSFYSWNWSKNLNSQFLFKLFCRLYTYCTCTVHILDTVFVFSLTLHDHRLSLDATWNASKIKLKTFISKSTINWKLFTSGNTSTCSRVRAYLHVHEHLVVFDWCPIHAKLSKASLTLTFFNGP